MKNMRHSINEILENPDKLGQYFGFYDWFCYEGTLAARATKLLVKLEFLVKEGMVNGDSNYVWFKNNCPVDGSLYDDIRISNIKTDAFLGGLCPSDEDGKAMLWLLDAKNDGITEFKEEKWNILKSNLKNDTFKKEIISRHFGVAA